MRKVTSPQEEKEEEPYLNANFMLIRFMRRKPEKGL